MTDEPLMSVGLDGAIIHRYCFCQPKPCVENFNGFLLLLPFRASFQMCAVVFLPVKRFALQITHDSVVVDQETIENGYSDKASWHRRQRYSARIRSPIQRD